MHYPTMMVAVVLLKMVVSMISKVMTLATVMLTIMLMTLLDSIVQVRWLIDRLNAYDAHRFR